MIIIKIGTGVLTREADGMLDEASLVRLVTAIAELVAEGVPCVMVSSGAVGAGVSALQLDGYPDDTVSRQACAAVGQTRLMRAYEELFQKFRLTVAQILLTADDFKSDKRRSYVSSTLHRLLEMKNIIPIINENDTVAVRELRVGDNDMLSAKVADLLGAEMLVMLSTVDGLQRSDGSVVDLVEDIDAVEDYVRADHGKFSIGGMASKLKAIKKALNAGVEIVIASGRKPQQLKLILSGDYQSGGTRFKAKKM